MRAMVNRQALPTTEAHSALRPPAHNSRSRAWTRMRSSTANKLLEEDRPVHDWYRFVLSFPPHLIRTYLTRFHIGPGALVLDPFCGTGTTLVECKKLGITSVGVEANHMTAFASAVKVDWAIDPRRLIVEASRLAGLTHRQFRAGGISDEPQDSPTTVRVSLKQLPIEQQKLLLTDSMSPLPLHKTLVLARCLERNADPRYAPHLRLALAKALVTSIGNLHFGPEIGVTTPKPDAPVVAPWLQAVRTVADDLHKIGKSAHVPAVVHHADARQLSTILAPQSIDVVITSPPYPNEKDYTRSTRLESVILGFLQNKVDLRRLKESLLRSNTRNVYKGDGDDRWIDGHPNIQRIARAIERRRIALGKTSGFERMYHRVTLLYFGGMARHLADLRPLLRPGARLAYVVGDQASYLRVMIRTGHLLADIAESMGYEVMSIDLFRSRLATATRALLREEVLVLRWPGFH